MAQKLSWQWIFWIVGILEGFIILASLFTFEETYAPLLLDRKASALRKESGNPAWHTSTQLSRPASNITFILNHLLVPIKLLFTNPALQITTVYKAFNYGMLYLVLTTFATVWQTRYGQSLTISGFHYIAFVVGEVAAAQAGAFLTDSIWRRLKRDEPEARVPLMFPGALIMTAGLLLYGWSAQQHFFWLVLDIGVAMIGCGLMMASQAAQAYIIDAFSQETVSSASSASQILSSIFAFAFPLFAPKLYAVLGFGWGNTTLALLELCFGLAIPWVMWKYGKALREKGR